MTPEVSIQLISPLCKPQKAYESDAGYDLFSRIDVRLFPGDTACVPAGFYMELPRGWEAQIRSRSGLALKSDIQVLNSPGTVDPGFRGEVSVILKNANDEHFFISEGSKIAQMVIKRVPEVRLIEVDHLNESERGTGGFGSTG